MILKQMGRTGISVAEIGLGTYNYKSGVGPMRKGLEAGALFIDTAETYGTETIVGQAIAGMRDRVFLATKVHAGHFSKTEIVKAADRSLQALRTDWIDLYQLHSPDDDVPIEETMEALEGLVEAGKIRFIGVSNFFYLTELKRAQRALRKNRIVANQMCYHLADRNIEGELLDYCRVEGISIIGFSPLAQGLPILLRNDPNGVITKIAQETGKTVAQVALNWCVRHEHVFAIPKGDSETHILDNCGASGWRLSPAQVQLLNEQVHFARRGAIERIVRRVLSQRTQEKISHLLQRLRGGGKH
jgi:diketogulonate reductase-like aldo/keto reductase